jgi:cell division protein FtsX
VYDLDERLAGLAAEATRDAVPPGVARIARRGRRRRRRQLAGTAALVAAVVAAGLVLPARLAGGGRPLPATAPATDVTGAANLGGFWFGKADASVYLRQDVTPAQRDAIRRRLQALPVVDQVYYESKADAWARFRMQFQSKPEMVRNVDPYALPESFRVRLDAPEHYKRLQQAICPGPPRKPAGSAACMAGVDSVIDNGALVAALLVPKPWPTASDATVLLPPGSTDARRQAIQARLETIDGVAKVTYESPQEAFRRLPEQVRKVARNSASPVYTWRSMPAAFRVALDDPARTQAFHLALCGSRTTGACPGGLVVLEHPRKR